MHYKDVIGKLKQRQVDHIYLLHGEEKYLARQIERTLTSVLLTPEEQSMNLIVFESDPPELDLINHIETIPFMGEKQLIIVRNTRLFDQGNGKQTSSAKLFDVLADIPPYTYIMFVTDKADKRIKEYKLISKLGVTVELTSLKAGEIKEWLRDKFGEMNKKITADALDYLTSVISLMPQASLELISNEIEKIELFCLESKEIKKHHLMEVLAVVPEVSVFAMTDALSQKKTGEALALLDKQLTAGVYPLRLLGLLAFEINRLWQIKDLVVKGAAGSEIAEKFKLSQFVADKLIRQSRLFDEQKLKGALLALAEADVAAKSGGTAGFILEKMIIELCS